jgi:hypothetical protein
MIFLPCNLSKILLVHMTSKLYRKRSPKITSCTLYIVVPRLNKISNITINLSLSLSFYTSPLQRMLWHMSLSISMAMPVCLLTQDDHSWELGNQCRQNAGDQAQGIVVRSLHCVASRQHICKHREPATASEIARRRIASSTATTVECRS